MGHKEPEGERRELLLSVLERHGGEVRVGVEQVPDSGVGAHLGCSRCGSLVLGAFPRCLQQISRDLVGVHRGAA